MTARYKKAICCLLKMLHEARKEPFSNIQKWLTLQEALIKKLVYIENKIRHCKKEINELNIKRKNPEFKLTKEESIIVKESLNFIEYKIDEYKWLILILKSIGDGIAFTFIHKLDIKPQNFKESPGFISGKKGIILEKKILRYSFKRGLIAIMNDLTSVLKYADITLINEDIFFPIEVKTSVMDNSRINRQKDKTNKLYKYLFEDVSFDLYGDGTKEMRRVEIGSSEINYIEQFNKLLLSAKKKGYAFSSFEDGFSCLIAYEEFGNNVFDKIVEKGRFEKPIFFHLNMNKFVGQGYYPFSLIFNHGEQYWDFLEGLLNIIVFIDISKIERTSKKNGFIVERAIDENWAFSFKSVNPDAAIKEFKMSEHFFFRSFMELVSIDWLLTDTFDRIKNEPISAA